MLKRNLKTKSIHAYYHSGLGDGIEIDIGSITENWLTEHKPPPETAFTVVTQSDSQKSNENVTHSTDRKEQREKERKEGKSKVRQEARHKAFDDECQKMRQNRILMCNHIDPETGRQ